MPEDRSLDDFAEADAADGEAAEAATDDAEGDAADSAESEGDAVDADVHSDASDADVLTDASDADPAVATSTWHADGAECDRCGERAERRWREEDAFVCADCASW